MRLTLASQRFGPMARVWESRSSLTRASALWTEEGDSVQRIRDFDGSTAFVLVEQTVTAIVPCPFIGSVTVRLVV